MKRRIFIAIPLVLLFISGFLFSCNDLFKGDDKSQKNGTLVVMLTDAPFPVSLIKEANVIINKIEIRKKGESEGSPYLTISEEPDTLNLIELRNGLTEELAQIEIPAGTYDQLRLYVGDASVLLTDSTKFDLKIPSGQQSGIKIFIKPALDVEGGITTELLLDFSLEKSFVVQGNPNTPAGIKGFHFSPVIKAVNNTTAGRLTGKVQNDTTLMADAQVWVKQDTVVSETITNSDGIYAIIGLPQGTYTAFATKTNYDTAMVSNVNITSGNQTVLDFIIKYKGQ